MIVDSFHPIDASDDPVHPRPPEDVACSAESHLIGMVRTPDMALPNVQPTLSCPTVVLRPFEDRDCPLIQVASADPLTPLITSVPANSDHRETMTFIERNRDRVASGIGYSFAIAIPDADIAVGHVGLWPRDIDNGRASIVSNPFGRSWHSLGLTRPTTP
jgi:hypothetical protein